MTHPIGSITHRLEEHEIALLKKLRQRRPATTASTAETPPGRGARVADAVARMVGSWPFIIVQSVMLAVWIALNIAAYVSHWDPYPFILLNLALSFQAAYAAPFIMMSQNRQAAIDRHAAQCDYDINIKAELEIELLHQKIDLLREKEILELTTVIRSLEERLKPQTA